MERYQELLDQGLKFVEPYPLLQALLIIVGFLVLAKFVDILCGGLIRRLTAKTKTKIDDQIIAILHRPIFVTVALFGLIVASTRLEIDDAIRLPTIQLVQSIIIIIWLIFGLRLVGIIVNGLSGDQKNYRAVHPAMRPLLRNALSVLVLLAGAYAILIAWDINVTGLVASAGIMGLALSFAAQDTLANLFAGVAIMIDRPYQIGDFIILDSGERGEVTSIGLRSTRLLTRDDVEVTIPNSVMGAATIVNEAGGPRERYRIRMPVGVAYGSDIDKVMDVLLKVGNAHPKVSAEPEARARFRLFGESSLDFELLCWIADPVDRGKVTHELNCGIYKAFAQESIEIPFPQRDLYIKEMPSAQANSG